MIGYKLLFYLPVTGFVNLNFLVGGLKSLKKIQDFKTTDQHYRVSYCYYLNCMCFFGTQTSELGI